MYTDRTIACLDCETEFTFTAGEQEFYAQRGFTEAPKRCQSCRTRRKAQRQPDDYRVNGGSAGGYGSRYSTDDGSGFGAGSSSGRGYDAAAAGSLYGERRQREMFEAVCADCGSTARVPFRPSGARPVYCSTCFQGRR